MRRPPSWASAHRSEAASPICAVRCSNPTTFAGSSWRLATPSDAFAPTMTSIVPAKSDWAASGSATAEGTNSSTSEADAPSPIRTMVRLNRAWPGAPSDQRTTIGFERLTPAGTSTRTPSDQSARVSWANLSSPASASGEVSASRTASRSARRGPTRTDAAAAASERATTTEPASSISMSASASASAGKVPMAPCWENASETTLASSSCARRKSMYGVYNRLDSPGRRSNASKAARRSAVSQSGSRSPTRSTSDPSTGRDSSSRARRAGRGREAEAVNPTTLPSPSSRDG